MNYETAFINRNFLLKVYGTGENGERINRLVGVSGLINLIGVELANKFINRAPSNRRAALIQKPIPSSARYSTIPIKK